jgi:4-hydroxybutyryl-CoA dehydratase/vinylacetyl-CoA-Delta-isomerase
MTIEAVKEPAGFQAREQRRHSMRTREQYIEGLRKMRKNLYYNGSRIDRDDELQQPALNVMGVTFDAVRDPELKDLCTATSHLTGQTINRFCHIHQNPDDLHKKQNMTRALCRKVGFCIQRCMGIDAVNAVNAVSFEADRSNGGNTEYHKNFLKWLEYFQTGDLVGACAQTDVKGERLKRPIQQTDPDMYLHVVEKKSDGIVVRGCKLHISEASIADEIMVIPTRALGPDEKEYAVAFAIPADHEGVKQVLSIHNFRGRKYYKKGFVGGYTDSYLIFDNVFVPWERVFLCGENDHGGVCALLFALFHRHSYSGCKPAIGDVLTGMASLAARHNGIRKTSHVREMLSEFIKITELGYAAGYTASALGKPEVYIPGMGSVPYGPGSCIPNSIYANVGRCLTGEAVFKEQEMLCSIAGGLPATFPNEGDLTDPELKPLLEKYLMRNPDVPIEDQIKFWMLYIDYSCSGFAGPMNYGNYHGGGSPIMEQIAITSQYNIKLRENIVNSIAGIEELKAGTLTSL